MPDSIVHPFLLADNRHYPFYVWRRIINFNHYSRYALAPGYLAAAVALKTVIGTWCLENLCNKGAY